jgi:hypothetical protein
LATSIIFQLFSYFFKTDVILGVISISAHCWKMIRNGLIQLEGKSLRLISNNHTVEKIC